MNAIDHDRQADVIMAPVIPTNTTRLDVVAIPRLATTAVGPLRRAITTTHAIATPLLAVDRLAVAH